MARPMRKKTSHSCRLCSSCSTSNNTHKTYIKARGFQCNESEKSQTTPLHHMNGDTIESLDITKKILSNSDHNLPDNAKDVHSKNKGIGKCDQKMKFKCQRCSNVAKSKSALMRHVKDVHDKIKDFQCPHCEYSASQKGNLKAHVERHLGKKRIKTCSTKTRQKASYKCKQCPYKSVGQDELQIHLETVHGRKFKCLLCSFSSNISMSLNLHIKSVHKRPQENTPHENNDFTITEEIDMDADMILDSSEHEPAVVNNQTTHAQMLTLSNKEVNQPTIARHIIIDSNSAESKTRRKNIEDNSDANKKYVGQGSEANILDKRPRNLHINSIHKGVQEIPPQKRTLITSAEDILDEDVIIDSEHESLAGDDKKTCTQMFPLNNKEVNQTAIRRIGNKTGEIPRRESNIDSNKKDEEQGSKAIALDKRRRNLMVQIETLKNQILKLALNKNNQTSMKIKLKLARAEAWVEEYKAIHEQQLMLLSEDKRDEASIKFVNFLDLWDDMLAGVEEYKKSCDNRQPSLPYTKDTTGSNVASNLMSLDDDDIIILECPKHEVMNLEDDDIEPIELEEPIAENMYSCMWCSNSMKGKLRADKMQLHLQEYHSLTLREYVAISDVKLNRK